MSEKRFLLDKLEKGNAILSVKITDSVSDDDYFIITKEAYDDDIDEIVDLLNEQQALINALKKENKELKEDLKKGFDVPIPYVENSMRRLRAEHKVDEQQATIQSLQTENIILKNRIEDLKTSLHFQDKELKRLLQQSKEVLKDE